VSTLLVVKVVATTWNWVSHLDALVGLCRALRADGHEVLIAGQPGMAPAAAALGFAFAPVGQGLEVAARFREFVLDPDATTPGRPAPGTGGPRALGVFAELAADMAPDLTALVHDEQPDLLLFESTCWAGWIAASATGVPAWRVGYGVDLLRGMRARVADVVAGVGAPLGATAHDPYAAPLIDPCPPSLQVPGAVGAVQPVRYRPQHTGYSGAAPACRGPGARVCVTWGTTMARLGGEYFLLPDVVRALADIPGVEVVAALTAGQRALAGPLPPDVTVAESARLSDVVAGCDLLVGHGGAGSVLTGCVYGVPQVLVPQLPDHAGHAARMAAAGAAQVLPRTAVADGRLRAAVLDALDDPAAAAAAGSLADEIAAAPPPSAVARRLAGAVGARVRRPPIRTLAAGS
jgi:UDP:flavonoid glycosyltransferase YjiC (YdhE family)